MVVCGGAWQCVSSCVVVHDSVCGCAWLCMIVCVVLCVVVHCSVCGAVVVRCGACS